MTEAQSLLMMANTNYRVVLRQVDGLTHEDTLIQPPYYGNCLNWVLGHIVSGRNRIHSLLQLEPIWNDDDAAIYKRESQPLTAHDQPHFYLERLLTDYGRSQEMVAEALTQATPEFLSEKIGDSSRGYSLTFFLWHEGYHVGQCDILRQVAGKNDKVI
ncbi:MAG: DinB family protein [Chloroflexi bacterium]|nr:DinB family protein [Chloroflexota bacterium]MBP8059151.1 DinB family protein [Chloroflexota bacterium]